MAMLLRTILLILCFFPSAASGDSPGKQVLEQKDALSGQSKISLVKGFRNPGFEDGKMEGWTVGGRKDATAVVIKTGPVFKTLSGSRKFRRNGGWERHPVAEYLDAGQNHYAMRISSSGYISATANSLVRIEAGRSYEVSLVGISRNGGPSQYYLDVFYLNEGGGREILGSSQIEAGEGELFRQSVVFNAGKGQPHVGKRIGLSARYRGTNVLDQATIVSRPVEHRGLDATVQQLPFVDTLNDSDGSPRFKLRAAKGHGGERDIQNTGAAFEALAQFTHEEKRGATFYDLEGLVLQDGEATSVNLTLGKPYSFAGFAIDGHLFLLGRDPSGLNPIRTPDNMSWIAKVSREMNRQTLFLHRDGDRIEWYACGRRGEYTLPSLAEAPPLSLFATGLVTMGQYRHGTLSGAPEDCQVAPPSPFGRRNYPGFPEFHEPDMAALVGKLSADLAAPLSSDEIEAMVAYSAGFPAHGFGANANPLFSLPKWFEPSRIFEVTRRKEVLDHLIRMADAAIVSRNGFEGQGVKIRGQFNRYVHLHGLVRYPNGGFDSEAGQEGVHFNQEGEYTTDFVSETSDSANSRTITPAMAAFWISQHPEIWHRPTPSDPCKLGRTYRERAERYVKELALNYEDYRKIRLARFRTEPLWDSFAGYYEAERQFSLRETAWEEGRHQAASTAPKGKKDERVAAYDAANPRPVNPYKRAAVNRFVSAVSCAGFAARAAERFGDTPSMNTIDACAERLLSSWFNTYHFLAPGHDGEHRDDPSKWYRVFGYTAPNVRYGATDYELDTPRGQGIRSEDRAHMNFTLNGIQLLYESGRYPHILTPGAMSALARTIDEMVLPEYNLWRPLPRARKHRDVSPQRGFSYQASSLLMFGDFHPGLRKKLIRCLQESGEGHPRVMNLLNIVAMRALHHDQIPKKVVED